MTELIGTLNQAIINPLIALLVTVAVIVFAYGIFVYVSNANKPEAVQEGYKNIIWGLVGLTIMISALTIIRLVASTVGVNVAAPEDDTNPATLPREACKLLNPGDDSACK